MRVGRNLFFSLVVIISFFLLLEVRQRVRHPEVGFRGMYNSLGFRSPEFDPVKKPGTVRMLFLGSSTTFGVTGPVEKTFPYLVEKILREQKPTLSIETINAARPAKTSYWEVERMHETLYLEPDIVVLMTGYNDSATVYGNFVNIGERGDLTVTPWVHRLDTFIAHHSVFYVTFKEKISLLLHGSPNFAFSPPQWREPVTKNTDDWFVHYPRHFRKNLERMIEMAGQHGIRLVFLKPPLGRERRENRPLYFRAFTRLMKELDEVAEKFHIPVIDLDAEFAGPKSADYIGRDGIHFTDAGNLALARGVSDFFIQYRQQYLSAQ